jgi:hypothetical protein
MADETTRWCKLCEFFIPLNDDLKIVFESRHGHTFSGKGSMLVLDLKLGIMHSLASAAQTKRRLAQVEKVKGEVITVRNPNLETAPVHTPHTATEAAAIKPGS